MGEPKTVLWTWLSAQCETSLPPHRHIPSDAQRNVPLAALLAFTFKDPPPPHTHTHSFLPHSRQGPSRSVPWLDGGNSLFSTLLVPQVPGRWQTVGETLSLREITSAGGRKESGGNFHKLTTFKKSIYFPLNVALAAAPFKCKCIGSR